MSQCARREAGQSIVEYLVVGFLVTLFCVWGTPFFQRVVAALESHVGVAIQGITAP